MEYDPKPPEKTPPPSPTAEPPAAARPAASPRRNPFRGSLHARPSRRRRWLLWTLPLAVVIVVGLIAGVAVAAAIHMPRVDDLVDFQPGLITELYDREGDTFATFARQRRVLLQEDEVPDLLRDALIAVEDANFYQHGGIDLTAVIRAAWADIRARRIVEGAGTLTMQLARQVFLTREQTWQRKIEEALLAVELEKNYTKPQILTLYINLVNLGHGNYGFASAARYYFDKDVDELNVAEAATLAGIVQRPSEYSPYRRPDLVKSRRDKVLRRMLDEGLLAEPEYRAALATPLLVVDHAPDLPMAPYFAEDVRKYLEASYGTDTVHDGGLKVWTTVDADIQRAADEAVVAGLRRLDHRRGWRGAPEQLGEAELEGADLATYELPSWTDGPVMPGRWYKGIVLESGPREATVKIHDSTFSLGREGIAWTRRAQPDDLLSRGDVAWFRIEQDEEGATTLFLEQQPEIQGAAVVLESATGAVRAMVGGWDFDRNKFNRVTQAARQVGSAFKPFVFGAALEMGYTPADTIFDAPTGFRGADGKISYWPRNYTRDFRGIVTLRYALEHSINVPAVKLLDMVGIERVIDFARRAGIEAELPPYPSLALGSADIPPIELASAFAAIANQGTWVEPYLLEKVTTADGHELEQRSPVTRTVTDPRVAYVLTHMLEGVVDRGTAARLRDLPLDIAGKTGTTNNYSDAWFVGFTPRYTILVWVGYDVKRSLGYGMTGSEAALPIWRQIADAGLADGWLQEGERFAPPPGVTTQVVEYRSGRLPGEGSGGIEEAFVEGTQPVQQASPQDAVIDDLPWYQQRAFYLPKEGENMTSTDEEGQTPLEEADPAAEEPAPAAASGEGD
ncbi:MAG TPA: PBP1A family penicillin-binding protein [Thermoanaerobaculia bacterium]|nr:PBP1A family penicillin-binding protein [Thermoanaerobaculia bacterium]